MPNTVFMIASISANKNVAPNPETVNPGMKAAAAKMIRAFITSERIPRVRIVIGSVSIAITGLINRFINASVAASTNAPTSVTDRKSVV